MWCGGGDEMWGVSGQGSSEDEWGGRGQSGQLEHLFLFWFPIVYRCWSIRKRNNKKKLLTSCFSTIQRRKMLHIEAETAIDCSYSRPIYSKSWQAQSTWLAIHLSNVRWLLITLLAFMSLPGSQIISESNIHGMKCQYEILHNLAAWRGD